jgi:hypothetical protein
MTWLTNPERLFQWYARSVGVVYEMVRSRALGLIAAVGRNRGDWAVGRLAKSPEDM